MFSLGISSSFELSKFHLPDVSPMFSLDGISSSLVGSLGGISSSLVGSSSIIARILHLIPRSSRCLGVSNGLATLRFFSCKCLDLVTDASRNVHVFGLALTHRCEVTDRLYVIGK